MSRKTRIEKLNDELESDIEELEALEAAQAAVNNTDDGGDDDAELAALEAAQAAYDVTETIKAADNLKITDFNMVSNDAARAILADKGKPVLFEEPEDIKSNFHFQLVNTDENNGE